MFPREGGAILDRRRDSQMTPARGDNGEITADYGILAKYPNPYDKGKTIMLVAGIESVFQLGLTATLNDKREAKKILG